MVEKSFMQIAYKTWQKKYQNGSNWFFAIVYVDKHHNYKEKNLFGCCGKTGRVFNAHNFGKISRITFELFVNFLMKVPSFNLNLR